MLREEVRGAAFKFGKGWGQIRTLAPYVGEIVMPRDAYNDPLDHVTHMRPLTVSMKSWSVLG